MDKELIARLNRIPLTILLASTKWSDLPLQAKIEHCAHGHKSIRRNEETGFVTATFFPNPEVRAHAGNNPASGRHQVAGEVAAHDEAHDKAHEPITPLGLEVLKKPKEKIPG